MKWTDEKKQFLKDNVKGITEKELQERFNKYFNCSASLSSINNQKTKLKLSNGIVGGQFRKGHQTWNKGKKGLTTANNTSFKKGNVPFNRREVFEERITKDGYIEMKIQDGKLNENWQLKHRYIWEKSNGKIPEGHKIIFGDGNNQNLDLDNLILVSSAEELIMNRRKLRFNDKDATKTGHLIARVISKVSKVKSR